MGFWDTLTKVSETADCAIDTLGHVERELPGMLADRHFGGALDEAVVGAVEAGDERVEAVGLEGEEPARGDGEAAARAEELGLPRDR